MERFNSLFGETAETQNRRKIKIDSIPKRFSEPITDCNVCGDGIEKLQVVQIKPCDHMVHRGCLASWARQIELNNERLNVVLDQEVKCPACDSNITHIVYISDNINADEELTLADYILDYNRLTNIQLTVKFLSEVMALTREGTMIIVDHLPVIRHVARAVAPHDFRDDVRAQRRALVAPLVQEHLLTLCYIALAAQLAQALTLYLIGNNQTGAKYNKSRKHNKSNKSRKFRKSKKNLKIQKKKLLYINGKS